MLKPYDGRTEARPRSTHPSGCRPSARCGLPARRGTTCLEVLDSKREHFTSSASFDRRRRRIANVRYSRKIEFSPSPPLQPRTDRRADASRPDVARLRDPPLHRCRRSRGGRRCRGENLIGANLRGHDSHGVLRIPQYIDFLRKGDYQVAVDLKVENESPGVLWLTVSGDWARSGAQTARPGDPQGQGIGPRGRDRPDFGHIGRLGEYAERAAAEGFDPDRHVNNNGAGQRASPPAACNRGWGTNPLASPCPRRPTPSCSTSAPASRPKGKSGSTISTTRSPSPKAGYSTQTASRQPTPRSSTSHHLGSILPMGGTQSYKGFGLRPGARHVFRRPDRRKVEPPRAPASQRQQRRLPRPRPRAFRRPRSPAPANPAASPSYVRATPRAEGSKQTN